MDRWIAVKVPAFSGGEQTQLREGAAALGWGVRFIREDVEAEGAEILLGVFDRIPRSARWLCTPNAGAEPYSAQPGLLPPDLPLTNSSGAYGVTIAEHILLMALELLRRREEYRRITAERRWVRDLPVRSLHGLRVTLLGTGDIGQETARRLRAFEPACLVGVSRRGLPAGDCLDRTLPVSRLDDVLPETDLLICSLPGTPATAGLLDARRLALLPRGALLINVGRGSLLDEEALLGALHSGQLAGAALDVFRTEPLPAESPIWDTPGLIATPHISGNLSLPWTRQRVIRLFLDNLARFEAGEPLERRVDLSLGY